MANAAKIITLKDQTVAFAVLTGEGRKGKKPENEYVLAIEVSAKQKDKIIKDLTKFFDENKTAKAKGPAYKFDDWFTESKTVDGGFVFWGSEVVSNGITYKVAPGTGYTIDNFANMGAGSNVDVEYRFFYFNNSYGEGLGMRLSAVKLNDFVAYTGGGGGTLEGDTLQADGVQVASSSEEVDEEVQDFLDALEDGDFEEAKELLEELEDHNDYKKYKKMYRKAKKK